MRLKSLSISQYKNLKDFNLSFDGDSFIDVFVGKNGSGKSNLFEALLTIFRHLYEYGKEKADINFDYSIKYEIEGVETEVGWKGGRFKIDGKERKGLGAVRLPDNVLIYYSGHNETVTRLVRRYEDSFRKRIKKADFDESRLFIGIGPEYKSLLLSVLLMQKADNKARQHICNKLCIEFVAPEVKLVLQRPSYAKGKRFDIEDPVTDRYWKPEGITKIFLDRLSSCINPATKGRLRKEGYFAYDDQYILYLDIAKVQAEFADINAQELFRQFDNLKTLDMLADISIWLGLTNGNAATMGHFSDGQFQSVYIYSIIELFKDRNCLTLLDEPDAFLHPEWQFDFLGNVSAITGAAANSNHVLMSSHSASTITTVNESVINLFEFNGSNVAV